MPRSKRAGAILSELDFGFSAEELDADINAVKLARIKAAVDLKLGEDGANVLKKLVYSDTLNLDGVLGKVIESCINEIILYKALQEYRGRFSEEFIGFFGPNEQVFLRNLCRMLDQYILIQKPYAEELLSILDYSSAETFAEDLILIDQIKNAINAKKIQNNDPFAKIVTVMGTHRQFVVPYLANKLKSGNPEDKLSRFFGITRKSLEQAGEIPMRMSSYGRRFRNMSAYYEKSTLTYHAKRREQFIQVESIPTYSGCGYDLQAFFARTIVTGRTVTFREFAEFLDDKWELPSIGNVSEYFQVIYVMAERNTRQIVESEREYALCLMSFLPENDPKNAEKGLIYIDESTRKCVIRNSNGIPCKIKLPKKFTKETGSYRSELPLDLTNLELKLNDEALVRSVIIFLSEAHYIHGDEDSARIKPPKSVNRFSTVIGAANLAISYLGGSNDDLLESPLKLQKGHFLGVPADLYAEVSFFECVQTIYSSGWHLIYRRANRKRVKSVKVEDFKEGDFAEIYCKNKLLCTFTPQNIIHEPENVFNGVGLVVYNPDPTRIALATLILTGALAKKFKKEIYIHSGTPANSSEESSIALMYAEAILNVEAIPILIDDTKTFTLDESIKVFQALPCSEGQGSLFQDYNLTVERIHREQQEDKQFLSDFGLLLSQSADSPLLTWTKAAIVFRLTEITLFSRNLALDEFLEKMIDYMKKIAASETFPQELGGIKKNIQKMIQSFYINQNLSASPETLGAEIFNQLAIESGLTARIEVEETKQLTARRKKFQDEQFLKQFSAWLNGLDPDNQDGNPLLRDPTTAEELNDLKILIRLKEIASDLAVIEPILFQIESFVEILEKELSAPVDGEKVLLSGRLDGLISVLTQREKFLKKLDSALKEFPLPAARGEGLTIEDSTGAVLSETEILQRLERISVVHHNIDRASFIGQLKLFVARLNLGVVVSSDAGYDNKELVSTLITALKHRREEDGNFLRAFDVFMQSTSSESGFYEFSMINPNTEEMSNGYDIASRLTFIFFIHGNIDKSGFLNRFKILSEKINLELPAEIDQFSNKELYESINSLLSSLSKNRQEDNDFLKSLRETLDKLASFKGGSIIIKDPSTGKIFYEIDILNRLQEMAIVHRTIDEKTLSDILFRFTKIFFLEMPDAYVLKANTSPLELLAALQSILKQRKDQDMLFIKSLDEREVLPGESSAENPAIIMTDPNTGERLNHYSIISQLAAIFFTHRNIDRATFVNKFKLLAEELNLNLTYGGNEVSEEELPQLELLSDLDKIPEEKLHEIVRNKLLVLEEKLKHDLEQAKVFLKAWDQLLESRRRTSGTTRIIEGHKEWGIFILRYLKRIVSVHKLIDEETFLRMLRQFARTLPSDMLKGINLELITNPLDLIEKLQGILNSRQKSEKTTPGGTSIDDVRKGFSQFPSDSIASVAYRKEREPLQNLISDLKAEIALDPRKDWRFEESSNMTKIYDSETLVYTAGENKPASKPHIPQKPVSSLSVQDVYLEVHRHNDSDVTKAVNAMAKTMQTMRKPKLEIEVVTSDPNPQEIIKQYVCSALEKDLFPEVILNGGKIPPQTVYKGLLENAPHLAKQYGEECGLDATELEHLRKQDRKERIPPNISTSNHGFLTRNLSKKCVPEKRPNQEGSSHSIPSY